MLDEPWSEADTARRVSERRAKTGLEDGETGISLVAVHDRAVIEDVQLWLTDAEGDVA